MLPQVRKKIIDRHADVGPLMIDAIKSIATEQAFNLALGTVADDDVAANVQQRPVKPNVAKAAAKVSAPVFPFAIEGRDEDGVSIDLKRCLHEVIWAIA